MVTPEGIHTTQQSSNHQSNKRPKFSPPLSHKMKRSFKDCVSDDLSLGAEAGYSFIRHGPKSLTTEASVISSPFCHSSHEQSKTWVDTDLCDTKSDSSNVASTPPWNSPDSVSDSGLDSEEENVDFPFRISKGIELYPKSKIPFIDTHCHLDYLYVRESHVTSFSSFINKKDFPSNFSGCITCFCDPPAINDVSYYEEVLEEKGVWGTFGLHPHNALMFTDKLLQQLTKANSHAKSVAWGEMGLDYNNPQISDDVKHAQQKAFVGQLRAAVALQKPLVIHGRSADKDTFLLLKQYVPSNFKIHYHCFSGSIEFANQLNEYFPNLFFGITGLVTYKNPKLHEVVKKVPFHRLLIETDAPFLRPFHNHRLDRDFHRAGSTPGMGLIVAQKVSEIKELELDDVLIQIRENVNEMYDI